MIKVLMTIRSGEAKRFGELHFAQRQWMGVKPQLSPSEKRTLDLENEPL